MLNSGSQSRDFANFYIRLYIAKDRYQMNLFHLFGKHTPMYQGRGSSNVAFLENVLKILHLGT